LSIDKHFKRNDKLLKELHSLEYNDDNLKKFIVKCSEFKTNQKLLVEKIDDFRVDLRKLGITIPPELIL
jgi:hypothetical protein